MNVKEKCSVAECDRDSRAKKMCHMHYKRVYKWGTTEKRTGRKKRSLSDAYEVVIARSIPVGDCREYQGTISDGYGKVHYGAFPAMAHRIVMAHLQGVAYENLPPVHHTCANRRCNLPEHLQLVTEVENKVEMLARNYYITRIAALEEALREKDPENPLLT